MRLNVLRFLLRPEHAFDSVIPFPHVGAIKRLICGSVFSIFFPIYDFADRFVRSVASVSLFLRRPGGVGRGCGVSGSRGGRPVSP